MIQGDEIPGFQDCTLRFVPPCSNPSDLRMIYGFVVGERGDRKRKSSWCVHADEMDNPLKAAQVISERISLAVLSLWVDLIGPELPERVKRIYLEVKAVEAEKELVKQ